MTDEGSARERLLILEMIDSGRISAQEGLRLLQSLQEEAEDIPQPALDQPDEVVFASSPPFQAEAGGLWTHAETLQRPLKDIPEEVQPASFSSDEAVPQPEWPRWWMIPLWVGVIVTVFGGIFMYLAQRSAGIGWWFLCATVPFVLGLLVIVLAWQNRSAPWLHLNLRQPPGKSPERLAFHFPLPLNSAAWLLRIFGRFIPGLQDVNVEQVIAALDRNVLQSSPLRIEVNDPDKGEYVEISIG